MKPQVKLALYILTAVGTLVFGVLFAKAWRKANATEQAGVAAVAPASGSAAADPATNTPPADEIPPEREAVPTQNRAALTGRGFAQVILWGLLGLGSLIGLGALAAYDFSQFAGQKATLSLFDDRGEDVTESTYELVEKAYGERDFLEAIRLLREFLRQNPKGVHAQIRIAEIYEKDLGNPVAAALEYEEVLRQPLEPDRKGWTAIHLVNLYNRLSKPEQAVALMQRIVVECPDTPAAAKARERLASAGIELPESHSPTAPATPPEPPSNLPPGFRPKA